MNGSKNLKHNFKNKKKPLLDKRIFTVLIVCLGIFLLCSRKPGWCHDICIMAMVLAAVSLIDLAGTYWFYRRNRNNRDNGTIKTILSVFVCAILIFIISFYFYNAQLQTGMILIQPVFII